MLYPLHSNVAVQHSVDSNWTYPRNMGEIMLNVDYIWLILSNNPVIPVISTNKIPFVACFNSYKSK